MSGKRWEPVRTTFTMVKPGDTVQVKPGTGAQDPSKIYAAPGKAPKSAYWAEVVEVQRNGRYVTLVTKTLTGTASLESAAHGAITVARSVESDASDTEGQRIAQDMARAAEGLSPGEREVIEASIPVTGYATAVARMIVREGGYSVKEASELVERYADMVNKGDRFGSNTDYVAWQIMTAESKRRKSECICDQIIDAGPRDAEQTCPCGSIFPATPVLVTPAPTVPPLVTGHEAESHSRRGHECRICSQPVVDHESVSVKDGVAVAWWTGTVVDASAVLNPERVALMEARREAAKPACECPTPDAFHYSGCPALVAAFKGITADGHKITHGLAVWDYNREPGYVNLDMLGDDGWFHVVKAGKTRGSLMNAERVCVVDAYSRQSATQALEVLAYVAEHPGTEKYEHSRGAYAWRYVTPATDEVTLAVEVPPLLVECKGCPTMDLDNHESWCPLVTPTKCECESFVCEFEGTHALCKCPNQATETHFVALCPGCAVTVRQPVSPEAHAAFLTWEATEQERRMAEEAAEIAALRDVETQVEEIRKVLATHRCGRGTCTNEGVTPGTLAGMDVFWCVDHAVLFVPSEPHRNAWHKLTDSLATGTERERSCLAMDAADRVLWPLGAPNHAYRNETWYAVAMEVYRASEPRWTTASKRKVSKVRKGR